jgi:hypothetical protein
MRHASLMVTDDRNYMHAAYQQAYSLTGMSNVVTPAFLKKFFMKPFFSKKKS